MRSTASSGPGTRAGCATAPTAGACWWSSRRSWRARPDGFYSQHQAEAERLYQRYTVEQIQLLLEFVRNGREFNEREAALLEQENRSKSRRR